MNYTLSDECLMKTAVTQGSVISPILLLIYTIELQFVLQSIGVVYHCHAGNIQTCSIFESITETENIFGVIFNTVYEWMHIRRLELKSDKTDCIHVTEKNSMTRKVDIYLMMLSSIPVHPPNNVRNLRFVFDK